jgi:catalase
MSHFDRERIPEQLPVNAPKNGTPATNQRDSQMAYYVDETGENPSALTEEVA